MPGAKVDDLMHEWIEEDAVQYDLPTEEIIQNLCEDNKFLTDFIKKKGLESEMRQDLKGGRDERKEK